MGLSFGRLIFLLYICIEQLKKDMSKPKSIAHSKLYRLIALASDESYKSVWKDLFPCTKISESYDVVKMANMVEEKEIKGFIKKHKL